LWLLEWLRDAWGRRFDGTVSMLSSMQYLDLATGHLMLYFCSLGRLLALNREEVVLELEVGSRHASVANGKEEILRNRPELLDAGFGNLFGRWQTVGSRGSDRGRR
jgi:hypothetical protein